MKEIFQTFPINTVVMWCSSYAEELAYGVVAGYAFNSVDDLIVVVKPLPTAEWPGPVETRQLHPLSPVLQLTAVVSGDRLWSDR